MYIINKMKYDFVIVGGGPCGLAFAQCCKDQNKSVLLLESKDSLGGCHTVYRDSQNMFSEHSPRVYSTSYKTFIMLLNNMNINFNDLFTPYKFNLTKIGKLSISKIAVREQFILLSSFIKLLFNDNYGKNISMQDYATKHNFSESTKDYINAVCKLTDGATIEKYTLLKFMSLINQQSFYTLYQPKLPTDIGLFKLWKNHLTNTTFIYNANVNGITGDSGVIKYITYNNNQIVKGKQFIFAIPPLSLCNILLKCNDITIKNAFGNFTEFYDYSIKTNYIDYYPVVFHWDSVLNIPSIYGGFTETDWNLVYIVSSDYTAFSESNSKTVISCVLTSLNKISKNTGKTVNQSNQNEIIQECFIQLQKSFDLKPFTKAIVNKGVSKINGTWKELDNAWIENIDAYKSIPQTSTFNNMFTVGTHNGLCPYKFTSLESAVYNAVSLGHILLPECKKNIVLNSGYNLTSVVRWIILLLILFIFLRKS
jgi:hypothetical protein